jgi:hypothetical protein
MANYGPHLMQAKQTIMSMGMNCKKFYRGSTNGNINIGLSKYE